MEEVRQRRWQLKKVQRRKSNGDDQLEKVCQRRSVGEDGSQRRSDGEDGYRKRELTSEPTMALIPCERREEKNTFLY